MFLPSARKLASVRNTPSIYRNNVALTPNVLLNLNFGSAFLMNVPAGFGTGVSFFYAAFSPGSVSVYDGLDGTGNILATLSLPVTADPPHVWDPTGVSFAGTAKSVGFFGTATTLLFDNITLGSATPAVSVPEIEPACMGSVLALVTGALGLLERRRLKAKLL